MLPISDSYRAYIAYLALSILSRLYFIADLVILD